MSLYLVRTQQNKILGPFKADEISPRILDGEFDPNDEICSSTQYWIFLHEREEMKKLLGIEAPLKRRKANPEDEDTETQTETMTRTVTSNSKEILKKGFSVPGAVKAPLIEVQQKITLENPTAVRIGVVALLGALLWILFRVFRVTGF